MTRPWDVIGIGATSVDYVYRLPGGRKLKALIRNPHLQPHRLVRRSDGNRAGGMRDAGTAIQIRRRHRIG